VGDAVVQVDDAIVVTVVGAAVETALLGADGGLFGSASLTTSIARPPTIRPMHARVNKQEPTS
jgi:hypothetical protein